MILREIHLLAHDLPALRDFFAECLGLPTRDELRVTVGASELVFSPGSPARYHYAFNIPSAQFEAGKRWLAERVPLVTDAQGQDEFEFPSWDARAVYFEDPAGNIGELIARRTWSGTASLPFGPHSLLSVSEIGLVTDEVEATAERLCRQLGCAGYGTPSPEFYAVGDEEGLVIVVRRGRHWHPDRGLAAEAHPVRLRVDTPKGAVQI